MSAISIKSKLREKLTAPRFLILINMAVAVIALAQGLYVARMLGASGYGYIGILVTISGIIANLWDMRINDLAVRLHFKTTEENSAKTANAIVAILINLVLSLILTGTSILACLMFWSYFTELPPQPSWLILQGIISGCSLMIGTIYTLQRLTENYFTFGIWKLLAQLCGLGLTILCLNYSPDISGYYLGLLSASLISMTIASAILLKEWNKKFGLSMPKHDLAEAFKSYYRESGFIFSANFFSYSKMLSRSGDILLFGLFASDTATGVYRLARTLTDNLNIFTDALSQYYTPTYMKRMSENNHNSMGLSAKRFFHLGLLLTVIGVPVSYVSLHFINIYVLNNSYPDLDMTTAIMASNFFWFCGVHIWLWPSLLHHNKMKLAAIISTLSALMQMLLIYIFCHYFAPSAWLAAIASTAFYISFYVPLLYWWRKYARTLI